MKKRPTEKLNYDKVAKITEGFSGADVKALCEKATDIPLKESIRGEKKRNIKNSDLDKAFKTTESVLKQWFNKARVQLTKRKLDEHFKDLINCAIKLDNLEAVNAE